MVSTLSQSLYEILLNKPELKELSSLGLNITVANETNLKYIGYTECSISLPFLKNFILDVPMLVVPDSDFIANYPVILGTNVIRHIKPRITDNNSVPNAWKVAIESISCNEFTVKSVNKKTIIVPPYKTTVVNGYVRGLNPSVKDIVTENCENGLNYTVCLRVIKLESTAASVKIPVKIYNITGKPISIKPKSEICHVNQVHIVDSLASEISQKSPLLDSDIKSLPEELGLKINLSSLDKDQLHRVRELLGNWKHAFSSNALDIGKADIVKPRIDLTNEQPFKQPYRRISPQYV